MKKKLIIICQTPPPFLGQSLMHKYFVDDKWDEIEKIHLRTEFAKNSDQFGKFSFSKITSIIYIFFQLLIERIKGKIHLIYYPPSGPANRKTFLKDFSLLIFIRLFSKKIVFHFHADKFNNLTNILSKFELSLAKYIYGNPDLCIVILDIQKYDIDWINPKKIVVIENGIKDFIVPKIGMKYNECFNILYIGLLVDYKGIEDAIETINIIKKKSNKFLWTFVGGWSSTQFENKIMSLVKKYKISNYVNFVGEVNGPEKWDYFNKCDIMCLPTRNDLMPLCILESMMYSKPVVTTRVRTIPYIVDHNINGLLCKVKSPKDLADKIYELIDNRNKCVLLGNNGRNKFEKKYTIDVHLSKMKKEILEII